MAVAPKVIPKYYIYPIRGTGIADGELKTYTWTPSEDYTIKAILFRRKDGGRLFASEVQVLLENVQISEKGTSPVVFGMDWMNYLPIDQEIKEGQKLTINFTNHEGTSIDIEIDIVCERKTK